MQAADVPNSEDCPTLIPFRLIARSEAATSAPVGTRIYVVIKRPPTAILPLGSEEGSCFAQAMVGDQNMVQT
jgi:hypothetical protein